MKFANKISLLFIEPKFIKNKLTIDELTIKMFNEIKPIISQTYNPFEDFPNNWGSFGRDKEGKMTFEPGVSSMGHHTCVCGATSSGCDYLISNGLVTNLLCVHYLACHRAEIPPADLEKVRNLESSSILKEEDKLLLDKLIKEKTAKNKDESVNNETIGKPALCQKFLQDLTV